MSGTATIAITVGVAVAVLVGFFIVYYLGNVANSIYDVKVGVRKEFDKKVKELQEWVENDTKQRINWMRDENREEGKRFKDSMEGHLEETFGEMEKSIERLQADVASLQSQLMAMQNGRGAGASRRSDMSPPPAMKRPKANAEPALGEIEVPKTGIPDLEEAPDMAAPKGRPAPAGEAPAASEAAPTAVRDKPSPPPRPSAKPKPAGRSSVEKKAARGKKKASDEFETFNQFSEDFKPGS